MDSEAGNEDAFAIPDLWRPSIFAETAFENSNSWSGGLDDIGTIQFASYEHSEKAKKPI